MLIHLRLRGGQDGRGHATGPGLPPGRRRYKNRGVPHTPVFLQKSAELLEEGGVNVPRDARGVCKGDYAVHTERGKVYEP